MPSLIQHILPEDINAQSDKLWAEFQQHLKDIYAKDGIPPNIDTTFQGWAIQKIAFLQLAVLQLAQATLSGGDEV